MGFNPFVHAAVVAGVLVGVFCGPVYSASPDRSLRPVARSAIDTMSVDALSSAAIRTEPHRSGQSASQLTPLRRQSRGLVVRSLVPQHRPKDFSQNVAVARAHQRAALELDRWVTSFRARALAAGIRPATFDRAAQAIDYVPEVLPRDRNQSEFSTPLWTYLDRAVSETRIANGQVALQRHAAILEVIEARFGVEKEVVTAVWGMETNYGTFRGSTPTLSALATLAFDGRRGAFFEAQLIDALRIVQAGDVAPEAMTGSWAGAMGHTQFMPTSYLAYAVDVTGDGRRDIWSEDPSDALASTAAYLQEFGWVPGMPWGVEVRLPPGFDYVQAQPAVRFLPSQWAALGVVTPAGRPVRDFGPASVLLPAGAQGPAFLVFRNFDVIKRYNAATSYAMGVGHLADRIAGGSAFVGTWPRGDRALSREGRKELQARLTARGFDTGGVDGRLGPKSLAALRAYQKSVGLPQDGYAHGALLEGLR